jgi:PKD repeat protein
MLLRNLLITGRPAVRVETRGRAVNRAAGRVVETLEARVFMHAGHDHTAAVAPAATTSSLVVQPLAAASGTLAVSAASPANGSKSVAVGSNLTVTFNVAVTASSVTASTFELRDPAGNLVPAVVTYNATSRVATLDPSADLGASNNYYTATVKGGSAAGVRDSAGNHLAADFSFSFTTGTPQFNETTVFSGLVAPTQVKFAPDGRVFVAEKSGLVKVFDNLADTTATVVADFRAQTHNFWDRGLLGMALDPNFSANGHLYLLYAYDGDAGQNNAPKYGTSAGVTDPGPDATGAGAKVSGRLSRITVGGNGVMVPGSELLLIHDWSQQFPSHSIGSLQFGPEGALYASAGDGASFNYVDYGQTGNPFGDPANEGGAVRAQDVRSNADATGLDGTVIRINPANGAPWPTNPLAGDANARRIIANGLRNPFRMTFRPGTSEIWIGDVGWNNWEEINRIVSTGDGVAENFGWPAYEGNARQSGYDAANLPLLEAFYAAGPAAHTAPYYAYAHSAQVVSGSGEPTGGSSISGVAFYNGGTYAPAFDGALFFADYSRKRIYVMYAGPNGLPDAGTRQVFKALTSGAAELTTGPGGDLYYVDMDGGRVQRFQYAGAPANRAPTAVLTANPSSGTAPLTVQFSGAGSSDPDAGDTLAYSWDLDGDGAFGDSTLVSPTYTYAAAGTRTVSLRVTDSKGASDAKSLVLFVGNTAPAPVIANPVSTQKWKVGDVIAFGGSATDAQDGLIAPASLRWQLFILHDNLLDPSNSHTHHVQDFDGVASGSFVAPDHEYPSRLELRLTATDAQGVSTTTSVILSPQTTTLTFTSGTPGLTLTVGGTAYVTPFAVTTIAGANTSVGAPSPQTVGGRTYAFASWSDGGAAAHNFMAPAAGGAYAATFADTSLPLPWQSGDVGAVGLAGSGSRLDGVYTIAGGGADIWNTADAFRFACQPLSGDGEVVARILSQTNTDAWAKAGVMIRESLAAGSRHAIMVLTPGNGASFQYRAATGGGSTSVVSPAPAGAPIWVRLVRGGNRITAYRSADGAAWTQVGTSTVAMGATVYAGLAVTAHNNGALSTATFDNVAVTPAPVNGAPSVAAAAVALPNAAGTGAALSVLGADDGGEGNLTYTWSVLGTPPAAVAFAANGTNASKSTTATFTRAGTYDLRVTISDLAGSSVASDVSLVVGQALTTVTVTPGAASLNNGQAQQFTATGTDQFGAALSPQPAFTWSVDAGGAGAVSAAGLYTAPAGGSGTAAVRAAAAGLSGASAVTFGAGGPVQTPFGGTPVVLPGLIEAEDFDNGGENVSFHDLDAANQGGNVYRGTAVDVAATADAGGGYQVGWAKAGEWLEYTVNVAAAGDYTLDLRYAAAAGYGGQVHVEFDGVDRSGAWLLTPTGSWATFKTATRTVTLAAGTQVMRLALDWSNDGGGSVANFNWLKLAAVRQPAGQTPYGGTPITAPGVIEAENFDEGGAGVAYADFDLGNNGGGGRATDVDMELTVDPLGGGHNLSHTRAGEWLEYTVNVPTAGTYTLDIRVAADVGYGGTMHVEFGGADKTGAVALPVTGGWQNYETVAATVSLSAGVQVMRLAFDAANNGGDIGNVNWLKLTAAAVQPPPTQTPFGGTPIPVAAAGATTIESEDFDNGGEGISFHDVDAGNTGGAYRGTAVDVQATGDAGGGYNVGWVKAGEWLEYTVNVAAAGDYTLDLRHAADAGYGGQIHVEFDGIDKTGTWVLGPTGGWQTFATASKTVSLSAGVQVLRVAFDASYDGGGSVANLNWLRLTAIA